jgi:aminoglycoside 6'-N-acetyltransferase I
MMALLLTDHSPRDVSADAGPGEFSIRRATVSDRSEYLRLRLALFPHDAPQVIEHEMQEVLTGAPEHVAAFVLERPAGSLGGLLEVHSRPVDLANPKQLMGYVGSWYVDADLRRMGWGSALLAAGEEWAREQGFTEMGSDCYYLNAVSYAAHLANSYLETERLIVFSKTL